MGNKNEEFILKFFLFLFLMFFFHFNAFCFTANYISIMLTNEGKYRIIIHYINLDIGEYREAFVDFKSRKEAIQSYEKLEKGADFFIGKNNQIYFLKEDYLKDPY
jgi:hypothetical protein